jgi:hypothetical protein
MQTHNTQNAMNMRLKDSRSRAPCICLTCSPSLTTPSSLPPSPSSAPFKLSTRRRARSLVARSITAHVSETSDWTCGWQCSSKGHYALALQHCSRKHMIAHTAHPAKHLINSALH